MATVSTPKRTRNVQRFVRLLEPFDADGRNAVIRILETSGVRVKREQVDEYFLDRVPSDFGEAYLLEKREYHPDPEADSRYHVNMATAPEEGSHSCECLGFLKHGHCRHIESLSALRNNDRI